MSSAIASARQRRAGISIPEPVTPVVSTPSTGSVAGGLTLPQVISLVDNRLTKLEKFMKDTKERPVTERIVQVTDGTTMEMDESITQILDEYNSRFMLLAEEIAQIKDTIMKLQSYTMDVNKMLLEERVNVLSDLGQEKGIFMMGDDTALIGNDIERIEQTQV